MNKLPSFKYKGMTFHNIKDNLFQTERFGDKLIYKFEDGKYHLVRDQRLSNIIEIGDYAFKECKGLTTVSIGSSVTSIGGHAFMDCTGLKSVNIPNSTITIGISAFQNCIGLTSITFGNSVVSLGDLVFWGCPGLKEVHNSNPTPPSITSTTFYLVDKLPCYIYVPINSYSVYKVALGWSDFKNIIEEGVATSISEIEMNKIQVYTESNAIVVKRANLGETVSVYTLLGTLLQKIKVTDDEIRIVVPVNNVYLIRVGNKTFKVISQESIVQ